jgi:hypothetical protein
MDHELKKRCEIFIENKNALKAAYKLDYPIMHCLCALIYGKKTVDVAKIKESKQIIKQNTAAFSSFKANAFLAMATMLSLEDDPETIFKKIIELYTLLKKKGFWGSDYLALTAFTAVKNGSDFDALADKAIKIYKHLKQNHPFLTSHADYCYAMLMALSNKEGQDMVREAEECYNILENSFIVKNAVQSLSFVLSLGKQNAQEKCNITLDLFDTLKQKDYKPGTGYELPSIGVLTLVSDNTDNIAGKVEETSDFLKVQKGFRGISIGKTKRIMFASSLVAQEKVSLFENDVLNATVSNTISNIIIAMEIAVIAAISASSAAAAASSGN